MPVFSFEKIPPVQHGPIEAESNSSPISKFELNPPRGGLLAMFGRLRESRVKRMLLQEPTARKR
jgi:hypothetical protein